MMFYPMQTTTEATLANHISNVSLTLQKAPGLREIAAEVQGGDQGCRHYFSIAH